MRTFVGIVLGALASGCACGADEGPPQLALSIPAEDVASAEPEPEPELAPWGVRFVRRCSEWSYHGLAADERHVFSCDGTVHELASGALIDPGGREPMLLPVARAGARTVWELGGSAGLVVRAADGTLGRPIAMPERVEAAFARGERLVGAGASGLVEVSLSTGTARVLPSSDACAWAHAVALTREGHARCVVRAGSGAVLRGIAGEPEVSVPWLESARFDAGGERLVGTREGRLELVDASGAIVLSRPLGQRVELLDLAGDRALVAADGRVVIVPLAGPDAPLEEVLALDAEAGRFAGDHVVISTRSRSVVWLRRGTPGGLPSREPIPAPPGLVAFEPDDREVSDPFDVATFRRSGEGEYTNVRVARLDREELAPFEHDDEAWGACSRRATSMTAASAGRASSATPRGGG